MRGPHWGHDGGLRLDDGKVLLRKGAGRSADSCEGRKRSRPTTTTTTATITKQHAGPAVFLPRQPRQPRQHGSAATWHGESTEKHARVRNRGAPRRWGSIGTIRGATVSKSGTAERLHEPTFERCGDGQPATRPWYSCGRMGLSGRRIQLERFSHRRQRGERG